MSETTTIESLRAALKPMGFQYQVASSGDRASSFFYRRVETKRPCLCNDRDQVLIYAYAPTSYSPTWSFEVELTGEFIKDSWAKLMVYSIRGLPELLEKLPRIQRNLVAAWEALGVE
jgi:hypothetical protein